jgi:hypothetical protein
LISDNPRSNCAPSAALARCCTKLGKQNERQARKVRRLEQLEAASRAERDVTRPDGKHFLVFVAKGTHGLYNSGGDQPVPSFSPDDPAGQSCGVFETVTAQQDGIATRL